MESAPTSLSGQVFGRQIRSDDISIDANARRTCRPDLELRPREEHEGSTRVDNDVSTQCAATPTGVSKIVKSRWAHRIFTCTFGGVTPDALFVKLAPLCPLPWAGLLPKPPMGGALEAGVSAGRTGQLAEHTACCATLAGGTRLQAGATFGAAHVAHLLTRCRVAWCDCVFLF